MDNIVYAVIPIGIYYTLGLVFYASTLCFRKKRHEGYTYINNTIRLEEM